ncbi:hypothetical protein IKN40_00395 [bacterium]|nr:hypothetical protein [bacterium]
MVKIENVDLIVKKLHQYVEMESKKKEKNATKVQEIQYETYVQKNVKKLQNLNAETVKKNSEKNVIIETGID